MRQIPLRSFLIIPFLLLFIVAAGAIGWMGYRSGQNSLEQFERQMAAEIGARITVHLEHFFAATALTAQTNAEIIRSGLLDPARPDGLQRHFVADIRQRPLLSYVSFGFPDGQYIGATRLLDTNEVRLMTAMQADGMVLGTFDIKPDNSRGMSLIRGEPYDARKRIWFRTAVENGRAGWYPVYKYKVYESLGIGFSVPVYAAESNRLLGVAAADIALDQIGRYLRSQRLASAGVAFVAETDGRLIATSLNAPVFSVVGDTVRRFAIKDFPDERIRVAGEIMGSRERQTGQSFLDIDGARYLLDVQQFRDAHGLTLLVGVVLPERDFSGHFESSLKVLTWLSVAVVAIGVLVGIYLTGWLVRPINEINRRAEEIAEGQLADGVWAGSRVQELDQLGRAFETMAVHLRGAFADLESKVAERTRALEVANVELGRLARLDGLTQIANRRSFDALLLQEWRRCLREQQPISLMMIDVDEFKAYNDHYGHQAGDDVLIRIAALCSREMKRPGDMVARYGGEEFVVVMPSTDREGALQVARAIAEAVRNAGIAHRAAAHGVLTVSIGIATQLPTVQGKEVLLIADADQALYAAKRGGRNRIEVAL
ncbi:MAG: diguanylate cyclase [Zoogloeaceae bacterium]|nr:diguanylate cyclase [Zoogloeaceae bacterium]